MAQTHCELHDVEMSKKILVYAVVNENGEAVRLAEGLNDIMEEFEMSDNGLTGNYRCAFCDLETYDWQEMKAHLIKAAKEDK